MTSTCTSDALENLLLPSVREKNEFEFSVFDQNSVDHHGRARFYFSAKRIYRYGHWELDLFVKSIDEKGTRSKIIRAGHLFDEMIEYFKEKGAVFEVINGDWTYGTNLGIVNELTAQGTSLEEAASKTWTGRQAAGHGFTKVSIRNERTVGQPGHYERVEVSFTRP